MSTFLEAHPERSPWGADDAFRQPAAFEKLDQIPLRNTHASDVIRSELRDVRNDRISNSAERLRKILTRSESDVLIVTDTPISFNAAQAVEVLLLNTDVVSHIVFERVTFEQPDAFKVLCAGIAGCHALLSFAFDDCGLSDADFDELAQAVARSERAGSALASASLRSNAFENPSFAFQVFARTTPALSALDLDGNARLGDACVPQLLAELSAQWMGLKTLRLSNCGFSQNGVRDLRAGWESRPLTISTIEHDLFL